MKTNYRVRDQLLKYDCVCTAERPSVKTVLAAMRSYSKRFGFYFRVGDVVIGDNTMSVILFHRHNRRVAFRSELLFRFIGFPAVRRHETHIEITPQILRSK